MNNTVRTRKTTKKNMSANELKSFYPTHPGSILKDEIEYRRISQCKLAKEMGIAPTELNEILNCRRPLTEKTALLFGAALDINAEPLLRMQMEYNLRQVRDDASFAKRLSQIRPVAVAP